MSGFSGTKAIRADVGPRSLTSDTAGRVGTSFKHEHLAAILDNGLIDGLFEVHAENYMGAGGPPHRMLAAIREHYPVSIHGVCMSIGGSEPLDKQHLARFRDLIARYEPALVSEHLAWSTHAGTYFNDLLPLPYTEDTLARLCRHIDQVQQAIARPILIENPSTYLAFQSSSMSESEFLTALVRRTGCRLLLDVTNVLVSATNHGYAASAYLDAFPLDHVDEIHLAGYAEQSDDEDERLLIDSHDGPVADTVWALYENVIERIGPTATLVEWDGKLPAWSVLRAQAIAAGEFMERYRLPVTTDVLNEI
ncbi:MNIO family bufferin maturase [Paraburkholderia solisilvae]|uniref:UPF0276 protein LMG29739_05691 n=1 Tax=Paraburkholderia solisilvae TaxID=624376 RepID=A0A6J5EXQ7_9BURK|nr:hypothetical protein LMG29739_05691 [Paraburkholderia solisilvae]